MSKNNVIFRNKMFKVDEVLQVKIWTWILWKNIKTKFIFSNWCFNLTLCLKARKWVGWYKLFNYLPLQKKIKLSTKITYGWKSICKIYITYGILSTDLYSYVKSALHMELSTDSNPYIKSTLHTNFYIRICIQELHTDLICM